MGGTVGKRSIDHGVRHLTGLCGRNAATRPERAEVDLEPQRLGSLDGRDDVRAGLSLDERLYGELDQQHATEL